MQPGDPGSVSGSPAGGDRSGLDFVRERAGELSGILEVRAERIRRELAGFYTDTDVGGFLARFEELHAEHVDHLRAGRVSLAHRTLNGIHDLSFKLEWEESWTDQRINHPGAIYELADDAFTRGLLVCAYVVGDMRRNSPLYVPDPPCMGPAGSCPGRTPRSPERLRRRSRPPPAATG